MLSQTYQMSTAWNDEARGIDPENRLLWRMPRARLDAETPARFDPVGLRSAGSGDGGLAARDQAVSKSDAKPACRAGPSCMSNRRSVYLPVLRSAALRPVSGVRFSRSGRVQRRSTDHDRRLAGLVHDERTGHAIGAASIWPICFWARRRRRSRADRAGLAARFSAGRPKTTSWPFGRRFSIAIRPRFRTARAWNAGDDWPGKDFAGRCCHRTNLSTWSELIRTYSRRWPMKTLPMLLPRSSAVAPPVSRADGGGFRRSGPVGAAGGRVAHGAARTDQSAGGQRAALSRRASSG